MKKNILLAVVGAAALTGCTSNEVMKERGFVPAPKEDTEITATAPRTETVPPAEAQPQNAPRPQSGGQSGAAVSEFPPMTGDFGGAKGISDDAGSAGDVGGGEYIVKRGDTLGKIAAAHRVKLSALMKANKLTEKDAKKLRIGRKLVIPSGKQAKQTASGKQAKADKKDRKSVGAANSNGDKPSIRPGEYIVKSGDTPEKIARRAGVRLSALMEANNLTEAEARRLRIGQKLTIPEAGKTAKKSDKPAPAAKQTAPKPEAKNAGSAEQLTGEMEKAELKTAAPEAAATPAAQVAAPTAEDTASPAAAEKSEVVVVPADISLAEFAAQHGTTPDTLRRLNADIKGDRLAKDAIVLVPTK